MKKRSKLSLTIKIIIGMTAFLLAVDAALGVYLMSVSIDKMESILRNKLLEIGATAATLLDGDQIEALTVEDKENNTPAYANNYAVLSAFKTSAEKNNAELAYIYCLVKKDDRIVFSIDPSDDPAVFLQEETIYTDALYKAFEGVAGFDTQSYVDRWGDLYTAYSPVLGDDGHVCAVVGIDVWASWYKEQINRTAISVALISAATIIVGVGLSLIITSHIRRKFNALAVETNYLESDIKELINGIRDPRYITKNEEQAPIDDGTFDALRERIHSAQVEIKQYIEYTNRQAYIDSLTGLGNRRSYIDATKKINEHINDEGFAFVVIVCDINGLKEINDNFGHESGDKAIVDTAKLIVEVFGEEGGYRIGGDEFVYVSTNANEEEISAKLKDFAQTIEEHNASEEARCCPLGISIGASFFVSGEDSSFSDVFHRADENMYAEKALFYKKKGLKFRH